MGEEERSAIADAIVEIDRSLARHTETEQAHLLKRRFQLVAQLRADAVRRWNSDDLLGNCAQRAGPVASRDT